MGNFFSFVNHQLAKNIKVITINYIWFYTSMINFIQRILTVHTCFDSRFQSTAMIRTLYTTHRTTVPAISPHQAPASIKFITINTQRIRNHSLSITRWLNAVQEGGGGKSDKVQKSFMIVIDFIILDRIQFNCTKKK